MLLSELAVYSCNFIGFPIPRPGGLLRSKQSISGYLWDLVLFPSDLNRLSDSSCMATELSDNKNFSRDGSALFPTRWHIVVTLFALLFVPYTAEAQAAPFDSYQLIMWQEHTPAEIDGLKRLGFTATKLRATGGHIDAADLDAHIASGLPWYLENIATDLYASYHRYFLSKEVNWRYNEVVARHLSDPADLGAFIRVPSLSDTSWRDRITERLHKLAKEQARYHPLFYNLADESGIADLAAAWDFDIGSDSLSGMRVWLATQYSGLAALNQEWGTHFVHWDEVVPELTDAALARPDHNYAAWGDFKAWMDVAFARAVHDGTDALHAVDPNGLSALEGAQVPGWGGYDYGLLAPAVDVMEIYDIGDAVGLAMAANPSLIVLQTSFSAGDEGSLWRSLLQGGRGLIVWDENAIVEPDGTPKPAGVELAREIADLRPIAPAILASHPSYDPVAVLASQSSFRTTWLLDRLPGGSAWAERNAARENEDNNWRAARRETLQRLFGLGIVPHLLTSPMLEAGALNLSGIRVLILPHAIALSDVEVAAIKKFAAAGGTVLADTEPGLFDGHSRLRDEPPLKLVARIPEALLRTGVPPSASTLDAEAALLAAAGVVPRAALHTRDGSRASGLEIRWLTDGRRELMSVQAVAPHGAASEIDINFVRLAETSDLRQRSPPKIEPSIHISLDPVEPVILTVTEIR